jgi:nitrite reductase/ring-hydroxylating ferredoxin subunit
MRLSVKKEDIPLNTLVEISKTPKITVYYDGQRYYAFSGICPHAKWPLELGRVSNCTITCGGHSWEFDITDGRCVTNPGRDLKIYKIEIKKNEISIFD